MVAVEKAGIPAVGIVARSFIRAWQACVEGWGQPSTAFVTIPHATTGQQAGFIRNMVDEQIDAVIQCLTTLPAAVGTTRGAQDSGKTAEIFTVEMDATPAGLDAVNCLLDAGIEVLHSEGRAVEACFPQRDDMFTREAARINFHSGFEVIRRSPSTPSWRAVARSTSPYSSPPSIAWLSPR